MADGRAAYKHEWYLKHREECRKRAAEFYAADLERQRRLRREWYRNNREASLAYHKDYRLANSEKVLENDRTYRRKNSEELSARRRLRYAVRGDELREKIRLRYNTDLGYRKRVKAHNRRRKRGLRKVVVDKWKIINGICYICGLYVERGKITVDHVYPKSLGGTHLPSNLMPVHQRCNSKKQAKTNMIFARPELLGLICG